MSHTTLLAFLAACTSETAHETPSATPEPSVPAAPLSAPEATGTAQADAKALEEAKTAAMALGAALKGELGPAMASGGPVNGITACSDKATGIADKVTADTGARVGRSTLRLRNPANAGPDWVMAWLNETGERKAEGLEPLSLVADTEQGRVARFLKPLAVEELCLSCHGSKLAPEVGEALAARYPHDAATGYALGDLRGVIWAEKAVE